MINLEATLAYLLRLADAQSGRGVLNRRSAGKPGYVNQATSIPIFPQDDRLDALGDRDRARWRLWPGRRSVRHPRGLPGK